MTKPLSYDPASDEKLPDREQLKPILNLCTILFIGMAAALTFITRDVAYIEAGTFVSLGAHSVPFAIELWNVHFLRQLGLEDQKRLTNEKDLFRLILARRWHWALGIALLIAGSDDGLRSYLIETAIYFSLCVIALRMILKSVFANPNPETIQLFQRIAYCYKPAGMI